MQITDSEAPPEIHSDQFEADIQFVNHTTGDLEFKLDAIRGESVEKGKSKFSREETVESGINPGKNATSRPNTDLPVRGGKYIFYVECSDGRTAQSEIIVSPKGHRQYETIRVRATPHKLSIVSEVI
ncbi:hypothetical protein [Haloferax prahovense]|uniref:hypothetical protein n=1 Tax=Haloferax prahovense TaxID=381852 RepID=UPI001267BA85|nr:hypothetical protein [Haloferax prahovense]